MVKTFHAVDPSFITDSMLKSVHHHCLKHLEKGCLSDHPEVNLYLELKQGSDDTFKKLKSARGSSQQEGFHFYVRQCTPAKTVSPILYDLFLADMTHRWNVDRATEVNQMPQFKCYDLALLSSIHTLWAENQELFTLNPVNGCFTIPKKSEKEPLEKFGCSRIINSLLLQDVLGDLQ